MAGIKDDGAMAEFMIADAANTVKLPDSVSFEQGAPLMCAGVGLIRLPSKTRNLLTSKLKQTTVWGGIKAANLAPKVPVGVIGIGGLGSLAIQFLKALGHPTVAIDRRPEPIDLAIEVPLKADLVIDSTSNTAVEDITRWADNEGLAAVIVCTDNVPVNEWSLKLLRVVVSQCSQLDIKIEVHSPIASQRIRRLLLKGYLNTATETVALITHD